MLNKCVAGKDLQRILLKSRGGTPLYGLYKYVQTPRVGVLGRLALTRVFIWPFWFQIGYGFTTFSSLSIRPSTKAVHNLFVGQLCKP